MTQLPESLADNKTMQYIARWVETIQKEAYKAGYSDGVRDGLKALPEANGEEESGRGISERAFDRGWYEYHLQAESNLKKLLE